MIRIQLGVLRKAISLVALAFICFASRAYGASISISGTVNDADGKPLGGAVVYAVADDKVKTTCAQDGSFTLTGTIPDSTKKSTPVAAAKDGCMTAQILAPDISAKGVQFKLYPAIIGTSVTLKGNRMNEAHLREEAEWDPKAGPHQEGDGKLRFVFIVAFDGPPGVKAEVDQIWADYHPGPSIDGDEARELENQFRARSLYYLDGPMVDAAMQKANRWGPGNLMSITGTISEKDGKKYITVTSTGKYEGPTYPERIMAGPEKPLVQLPVKAGLSVKLTDTLSDTLTYVPAGKFYMGNSLVQSVHWQEATQHMVALSKGFYLSDHPITNAEYAAVTGDKTRNPKNHPDGAACNMSSDMFDEYVKALEKLNPQKVIRAPSKAEWEYVARSGTSDIEFKENPNNRCGETCDRTVDVKSKKPNGWGFYGICFDDGSERSSDAAYFSDQLLTAALVTDPRYPLSTTGAKRVNACGGGLDYPINELINDNCNVGTELGGIQRNGQGWKLIRERILVEE